MYKVEIVFQHFSGSGTSDICNSRVNKLRYKWQEIIDNNTLTENKLTVLVKKPGKITVYHFAFHTERSSLIRTYKYDFFGLQQNVNQIDRSIDSTIDKITGC